MTLGPFNAGQGLGSNVEISDDSFNAFVEQRWIPVVTYSPWFVDGYAAFNAQFEVDFQWGLAANAIQNNQGGGFNADQVNLQTKNVNVALYPTKNPRQLTLILGTQPVYDTIYDPTRTSIFKIIKTGYKLSFLASDASGVSLFSEVGGHWKASLLPLSAGQPDLAAEGDATFGYAWLATLDYAYDVDPSTVIGASAWHLRDDTDGSAFAFQGLVRNGPSNTSGLPAFTGVPNFNIDAASGYVNYVGIHGHHNVDFEAGRFGMSGFLMLNEGKFESQSTSSDNLDELNILGLSANLEAFYQWGKTLQDVVSLEAMYSSGDDDVSDSDYKGAFTLNNYGLPGAVWFNHKTLLLFPFTSTVSNYTGAVTDLSNQGYGLRAAILAGAWDIIPDKLNLKLGAAQGFSDAAPPPASATGIERGTNIGTEVNAELKLHFRYLMTLGVHAAYMARGSFYDGSTQVTADPWAFFTTFTWYGF
ncbi:MAG: hypothetical protein AAFU77_16900 [Myxococcota bacterium]